MVCSFILFSSACAVIPPEKRIPYPEGKIMPGVPSDEDLFVLGTSYLGTTDIIPDYFNAKTAFEKLVKTYPESTFRQPAEQFIMLINEIQSLKRNRAGEADTLRLMRENAQLKKDIERLKRLEVESEKKEKMLR
jgi:hypothetical protein